MPPPRIRQLVFASDDAADIKRIQHVLGLGSGFVDPGVAEFGLTNGVFSLGDQFLEVVVPVQENTAAGRFIARSRGRGGYMVVFQTDDLNGVRNRADAHQIRRVWNADLPDISASHLHPADIGASIVSVDEARPPESWRWGGPDWRDTAVPGGIRSFEVSAVDPKALSQTWGEVLGQEAQEAGHDVWTLGLGDTIVRFTPGDGDYLSTYHLAVDDPQACLKRAAETGWTCHSDGFEFAGVKVALEAIDPGG